MFRALGVSISLSFLFCLNTGAQPTGTITGAVIDESSAVVPNANITITNKATGFSRATATSAEGYFSAPALSSGEYEVKAECLLGSGRLSALLRSKPVRALR